MKKEIAIRAADEALLNVGVEEKGGDNKGAAVKKYLECVGLEEGYSWCAGFLKFRYLDAAKDLNEELSESFKKLDGWTPNWKNYAQTNNIWIPLESARKQPSIIKKGYAVFYYSESKDRIYHCGIVISSNKDGFISVEGNTSPGKGIEANGDGVFRKNRSWNSLGSGGGFIKTY